MRGSSPLTRGKRIHAGPGHLSLRLIPAHAGKTCGFLQGGCEPGAHPRSRGENAVASAATHGVAGSSPLTRGKLGRAGQRDVGPRLIPAHAGKTTRPAGTRAARQAHPRSRGENPPPVRIGVADPGSSPLTRGKRCSLLRPSRSTRLIPAHAGKTTRPPRGSRPGWAHPRSRGENVGTPGHEASETGSSPLTRGKRDGVLLVESQGRLIPAHAGKTCGPPRPGPSAPAHPRSRGENSFSIPYRADMAGSSPLTRGKRRHPSHASPRQGLIPAHAGKTRRGTPTAQSRPAHPRSRGENVSEPPSMATESGSSPLTRGKPFWRRCPWFCGRLIPAHAGKT